MQRQRGFSLIEVLLAIATLAVGMLFIGGTFMLGVYFTTVSTQKSIAATMENEAMAKVQLYARGPVDPNHNHALFEFADANHIDQQFYPSLDHDPNNGQYSWRVIMAAPPRHTATVFALRHAPGQYLDPELVSSVDLLGLLTDGSTVLADDTGELLRFSFDEKKNLTIFDPERDDPNAPFDVWVVRARDGHNPVIAVFQKEL